MKELKHDIESYIITIRRKGQQTASAQAVTLSATPRMKPLTNESTELHEPQAGYGPGHQDTSGGSSLTTEITAPLPGIIVAIKVKVGDTIHEGQELALIEAMKMENSIESPRSGTIRSINVSIGDTVSEGKVIITLGV